MHRQYRACDLLSIVSSKRSLTTVSDADILRHTHDTLPMSTEICYDPGMTPALR